MATFLMCILEPDCTFMQLIFEVVSAFGTVGLSTGITPDLSTAGKFVIILVMYTGRLGAFTLLVRMDEAEGTPCEILRRNHCNRIKIGRK